MKKTNLLLQGLLTIVFVMFLSTMHAQADRTKALGTPSATELADKQSARQGLLDQLGVTAEQAKEISNSDLVAMIALKLKRENNTSGKAYTGAILSLKELRELQQEFLKQRGLQTKKGN
jgi:hypothetical protein